MSFGTLGFEGIGMVVVVWLEYQGCVVEQDILPSQIFHFEVSPHSYTQYLVKQSY